MNGCHLIVSQSSAPSAIRHYTENMEKTLDPAMAVNEHPNRVVEYAIWLRTYLYRHALLSSVRATYDWPPHYCNIGAQFHPKLTHASCNT